MTMPTQAKSCTNMVEVRATIMANGAAALANLDSLSPAESGTNRKMGEVMRLLVTTRDELIAARRLGVPCAKQLQSMNSIFSSIFGMEFPSEGLQWRRVCDTREALRNLIHEAESEQAKPPSANAPSR